MKNIISIFLKIIKNFLSLKKEFIVLQCHHPKLYCDNTRFLFEYLSKKGFENCYWNTSSKQVSDYFKKKNFKYINKSENFIKFLFVVFKTKMVIDTGTKYFNPLNLISSDRDIIKISTYHGFGPKSVPYSKKNHFLKKIEKKNHQSFDYINFTSTFVKNKFIKNFNLEKNKCLNFGFPRIDIIKNNKKINTFSYLTNLNISDPKIILYTPTWRPYKIEFPLNYMIGMNYQKFEKFLKDRNLYFFYSQHSIQNFKNKPKNFSRIIPIDHFKYPLYDPTLFMKEVKILLNDYSATSTEFSILKKPQLFFMPDFKRYNEYKGFLENYKKNLIGFEIKNYKSLIYYIDRCLRSKKFYTNNFNNKLLKYKKKYYERYSINSCKKFENFIKNIKKV